MSEPLRVLIVEDNPDDTELMVLHLKEAGFQPDWQRVEIEADFLAALEPPPDLILSDWRLPNFSGPRAMHLLAERDLDVPFVIVSGSIGEEVALEALRQGADDYVLKDRPARLGLAARRAIEDNQSLKARTQADQALRESEERYRQLVELSPDAIAVHCQGKMVFVNPSAVSLMAAHDAAELLGKGALEMVHPDFRAAAQARISKALQQGQAAPSFPEKFMRLDGTTVDVEVSALPITYQGKPAMQVIARDITERKRAETNARPCWRSCKGWPKPKSLDGQLELIRQSIAKVISAENFFVVFKNKSSGMFEEVYAVDKYDPPMPLQLEKSITSYVFRTGDPLLLTRTKFEELVAQGEVELVGTRPAIWLGAPLKTPNETIGVMAVQNYEDPDCYSEHDKEFLASVSTQVAVAIERKRTEQAMSASEEKYRTLVTDQRRNFHHQ